MSSAQQKRSTGESQMRKPFGSAVTLMSVVMLLSATSRAHACVEFDATTYTGATDAEAYTALEYEFSCPTGDFVQEYFVNEHDTAGYIEAIAFTCTDGTSSAWFGDQNETIAWSGSFALGMYQIESFEILHFSSTTDIDYLPYMGQLSLYGSYTTTSLSIGGEIYGPYGFEGTTSYASSATYTFCEDALATGVTVWADSTAVFGIQLKCAELSDTCIPPGFDYTATPAPLVTSSSPPSSSTVASSAPIAPFSNPSLTPSPTWSSRTLPSPAPDAAPSPALSPASSSDPSPTSSPERLAAPSPDPSPAPSGPGQGDDSPVDRNPPTDTSGNTDSGSSDGKSLSIGIIIGIAVGAAALLCVVIALVVFCLKRNSAPVADGKGGSQLQYPAVRNVAVTQPHKDAGDPAVRNVAITQPHKDAGGDSVVAEPPPAYDAIVTSPHYSQ